MNFCQNATKKTPHAKVSKSKFLPLCFQCVDSVSGVDSSLKRVAVVEDFFDIIYAMHVEISADPGKAPKHAGQKKTYKAVRMPLPFILHVYVSGKPFSC